MRPFNPPPIKHPSMIRRRLRDGATIFSRPMVPRKCVRWPKMSRRCARPWTIEDGIMYLNLSQWFFGSQVNTCTISLYSARHLLVSILVQMYHDRLYTRDCAWQVKEWCECLTNNHTTPSPVTYSMSYNRLQSLVSMAEKCSEAEPETAGY